MAKKKNNKKGNRGGSSPKKNIEKQVQVTEITPEQVNVAEDFAANEMPPEANDIPESDLPDTREDEQKVETLQRTGNVEQYVNFLRDKLKRIKALEDRAEKIKNDYLDEQKKIADERRDFEDKKKEEEAKLESDRKDLNIRQKKIDEDRLAIDNGEYTKIIQSLLDTLRKTEVEITDSTRKLVEDLGKKHGDYTKALEELANKQKELENEKIKLTDSQHELDRQKKRMELEKKASERRIREEVEDKYDDEIFDLKESVAKLEREKKQLQATAGKLNSFKQKITEAFTDPEKIADEQAALRQEKERLEEELKNRRTSSEYQNKVDTITILQKKISDLESQINEQHLNELRLSLHDADSYILEINTIKAKLDSAQAREKSLVRTVDDLHQTINRLKDEEKVKESAFEQAKRMDNNPELQGRKMPYKQSPDSMGELVEYLQKYMAKGRTPFYYEQKTIRTFLAGLHMSPLTILQGISGTGKTSLPREMAKALVAGAEGYTGSDEAGNRFEPYRICAIQSGWRDNMDLLGFYNNFEKKYKETDFFKAIYLAAQPKYKDTLFFIVLDEMNLSHPEHYFADFLSMMEQDVNDRYVKIQADEELLPKLIKERQMKLPPNVRFVGTANHDETTLDFAPKTYDRSNVMVLETDTTTNAKVRAEIASSNSTWDKMAIRYEWLLSQFEEAEELYVDYYKRFDLFIKTGEFLEKLKERGIGIGNRFDKQARKFICAYMACGDGEESCFAEAVDHLVTSRLFRTLKNRYDLNKDNLIEFKDYYKDLFKKTFNRTLPESGLRLLEDEIKKK